MSNLYKDWAVDLAIDRAYEIAVELNIINDNFIDYLAIEQFEKLLSENEFNYGGDTDNVISKAYEKRGADSR